MLEGTDLPADLAVFATRRSLFAEVVAWRGPARRIELPGYVRVCNRGLRFMSREIGIRGLDITMVWHPGWPIAHPLAAEGRAAVFWPNPAASDFARYSARCTRPNSASISSSAVSRRRWVTTSSGLPSIHSQKVSGQ
jgi:hypothetical protein